MQDSIPLVVASRNKGKIAEINHLIKDFPIEIKSLADFGPIPEVEEDGDTFDDNAYKKSSFTDLCKQADLSLKNAIATEKNFTISRFSENASTEEIAAKDKMKNDQNDLWAAYKYIADGEYQLVPKAHVKKVITSMEKYITHVNAS